MSTEPARFRRAPPGYRRGFTLIEIIITLVVLTVAVAAIAGLVANLARGSADPVLHTQAIYLAEGYLEEASLRPYADPDGIAEGCGVARTQWDDIGDYACLSTPAAPTDPFGNALPGLSRYRVVMSVGGESSVGGVATRRIEVQVTHIDGKVDVRMASLRASY